MLKVWLEHSFNAPIIFFLFSMLLDSNNVQTTVTKNEKLKQQPTTNNEAQKSTSKGSTMKVPDSVVHSPIKTRSNVMVARGSPLKCSLRLERKGMYEIDYMKDLVHMLLKLLLDLCVSTVFD